MTEEVIGNRKHATLFILKICLTGDASRKVLLIYRIGQALRKKGYSRFSKLFFNKLQSDYGVYIGPNARIGIGLKLPHPTGIVIGDGVVIGTDVTIYQQVTIGGARIGDAQQNRYPKIGDGTIIFAGAKLIGNITVGTSCVIGANCVVNRDIPDKATAVGVPAKILGSES